MFKIQEEEMGDNLINIIYSQLAQAMHLELGLSFDQRVELSSDMYKRAMKIAYNSTLMCVMQNDDRGREYWGKVLEHIFVRLSEYDELDF